MDTHTQITAIRERVARWRAAGERIAFVPTMGNLHDGHLRLVEEARVLAQRVVASIFVNPLQFNDANDFARYPRTLEQDARKLAGAGTDVLFAPEAGELYATGDVTRVHVPGLSEILCGAYRPGHFIGVTTVVSKLFNIVQPDVALFGQKDLQQLRIIERMVRDLAMSVNIVGVATIREPDGLAMSSRNAHLSTEERARAPLLFTALNHACNEVRASSKDFTEVEDAAMQALQNSGFRPEYVSIRRASDLEVPKRGDQLVVLAAAWLGNTRLIDNLFVL